jgi:membrane-associated phospholipid phosphatase
MNVKEIIFSFTESIQIRIEKYPPLIRNLIMTCFLFLIALPGYMIISYTVDISKSPSLALFLDAKIPFVPWTIAIYDWIYIIIFIPLFTVKDLDLLKAVAKAFTFVILISLSVFIFFPVKIERPELSQPKNFIEWWVWINYTLDKPTALFPSMHVSNAILSALVPIHWSKRIGIPALLLSFAISISTLTVKQHFIVDVIAGSILAVMSYFIFIRPYVKNSKHLSREEILLPEKFSLIIPMLGFFGTGILYIIYSSFTTTV